MVALSQLPPWPMPRRLRILGGLLVWLGMIAFCLAAWAIVVLAIVYVVR